MFGHGLFLVLVQNPSFLSAVPSFLLVRDWSERDARPRTSERGRFDQRHIPSSISVASHGNATEGESPVSILPYSKICHKRIRGEAQNEFKSDLIGHFIMMFTFRLKWPCYPVNTLMHVWLSRVDRMPNSQSCPFRLSNEYFSCILNVFGRAMSHSNA